MIKYEKTTWVDGETVLKADHMKKIEKGIVDLCTEIENITLEGADLSNYYTKGQTDNKISEEIAKAQLGGNGEIDLSAYATKNYVNDEISKIVLESGNIVFRDIEEGEIFELEENISSPDVIYGNIVTSATSLVVNETETIDFTVKLDKAPTNNQTVSISVNNANCTVNKTSLVFTPSNYSASQTVTVTGAHDNANYNDKSSVITLSSSNVANKNISISIKNIDESQDETPIEYTNLLYKSDTFESPSGYPTYWQVYKGTKSIIGDGHIKYTHDGGSTEGIFKCMIGSYMINVQDLDVSHKYYAKHKYSKDGVVYSLKSSVITDLAISTSLFNYNDINNGDSIYIKDCIVIDLTEMYGVDNEPTKLECDNIYGNLWKA